VECIKWQDDNAAQYNCTNDEYLQSFEPGKYRGTVANYMSFNTDNAFAHFKTRAGLFEACTGGKINFAEANDIAEDPINDLGTTSSTGTELYDAYLMIYSFSSEASSLGLLETLNDRIRDSNSVLKYEDIFQKVQRMGEYRKNGKTNIDLLMADGDFFVPLVRIDLLERDGFALPHIWEDVVKLAKFYNGTDLNDDGKADDYGFCIYPRTGSGFNDAWIPELMYSTWATTDQTKGIQEGFMFDEETFEPRIGKGFEHAMDIWKELWDNSADGCTTPNFLSGRCAIGYAPPGCWKSVFANSEEGGVAWRNEDGSVQRNGTTGEVRWRPRMKDGSYAEPYRLKPFGSLSVINRETDQLEDCVPDNCPMGERIPHPSKLPVTDRASKLVASTHDNKLINRVPFYWSGGYGTGIRKSADPIVKDMMWDFFVYVNSPITSVVDVTLPSWLDEWRNSQLAEANNVNYFKNGYSEDAWKEHREVMLWALGSKVNSALTLRLPGVLTYSLEVALPVFQEYTDGKITIEEAKRNVRQGWEDATKKRGKLEQLEVYRASLGLDGLSEYDLCRLHRDEMDKKDGSICVKYDPKESSSSTTILIAVLVPVLFLMSAGIFAYIYTERKRQHADLIWRINKDELKFDNPPEIAGRGTFGLVVKAEYRGTMVAVKQVIPPKNWRNRGVFSDYRLLDESESVSGDFKTKDNNSHGTGTAARKTSVLDRIVDDEELGMSSGLAVTEASTAIPLYPTHRRASANSETAGSVLSSGNQSHFGNGSLESSSNITWKRFFGSSGSTGKNYEQLKQDFIVEMRTLSKLRHPCITTVMGSVIDQKEEPMLVMEYMENGSLYDLLHNETMIIDGEVIFPILQDIARGARFLHAADPKVIHGDLKAANVLVDGRFRAKIADFGLSAKKKYMGACGTPYWMAPELLRKESLNTAESDVYSFGIILYELYSRKDPYYGENPAKVLCEIVDKHINKRPPVPPSCPTRIAEIMKECIDGNPEKRPSFEEIDMRIMRLDSENVEPCEVRFGHRTQKAKRASLETNLINQVFPKHVADALMQGRKVEPDRVDMATMFFSDIVGFTTIASKISPEQVSDMLDRLYMKFDELSVKHDVFKIETIGDAYVGVCNLVKKQETDHAKRVAEFAMDTLKAASSTQILPEDSSMGYVRIRVGIHCGPLVARVVGSRNPRYCVFGDTVNTAARMESHSLPMRIHCSDRAQQVLNQQAPDIPLESRGEIPIKGKGDMATFFIEHEKYNIERTSVPEAEAGAIPEGTPQASQ